ncbi:BirA family transcriptional regulator, biotin operon repressor / biotin-[acetyl-CoA-carboxylase] ligase [Aquimarina amphilecti]|uniref:BirA family transcriptional regulator, biotin operon repressor / biotin-[acetyl-CoA-carboxylase] ligase n=1 Tax=Aquimarina amphilecti TaxID=1038014 RepID=A0A1H7U896_AQUAM|nr:biotin--[acetyl-CoA-carboxylase] ligase [Aquimarina amphilecti]SEL92956.1 BirA family transcriptional regulator, biotin operon repressor / biotin-[acetyl-CoA-carboxylase] ligase [Aquimarina amphilecti]
MDIIKVDAIDSTNTFLRDMNREKYLTKSICVVAREQLKGKGQMGTIWQSNPGENLTSSVFMPIADLDVMDQFYISMTVSLGVYDALDLLMLPKLSIKWPNDILSDKYKMCGILIENVVNNGRLRGAIIGIGINVNQQDFNNLPLAGSLKQILGRNFDLDEVLQVVLAKLEYRFSMLHSSNFGNIKKEYESLLFRKNKPSTFLDVKGDSFVGIIQNITSAGKLQILLEDEIIQSFDLKEVKLLY